MSLIRKALNNLLDASSNGGYQTHSLVSNPVVEQNDHIGCSSTGQRNSSFFHRHSFQSWGLSMRMDEDIMAPQVRLDHRYSVCDQVIFGNRQSDYDPSYRLNGFYDDEYMNGDSPGAVVFSPTSHGHAASSTEERDGSTGHSRYSEEETIHYSKNFLLKKSFWFISNKYSSLKKFTSIDKKVLDHWEFCWFWITVIPDDINKLSSCSLS